MTSMSMLFIHRSLSSWEVRPYYGNLGDVHPYGLCGGSHCHFSSNNWVLDSRWLEDHGQFACVSCGPLCGREIVVVLLLSRYSLCSHNSNVAAIWYL